MNIVNNISKIKIFVQIIFLKNPATKQGFSKSEKFD
jgi:hypothetical protein